MGLIIPHTGWANYADSSQATIIGQGLAAASGTTGAANVDGSPVALITNTSFEAHHIVVSCQFSSQSATDNSCLFDIFVDPTGGSPLSPDRTYTLIPHLIGGYTGNLGNDNGNISYSFPLLVPSGSTFGGRGRSTTATQTVAISAQIYGANNRRDVPWLGTSVTEIGTSPSTSKGTAHTAGNS